MQRWMPFLSIALTIVIVAGCNRAPKPPADEAPAVDRISQGRTNPPKRLTHGTFDLGKFQKFPFEVPAHVIAPRVAGDFSSSTVGANGALVSDDSADVELMVMTEEQYDGFVHGRSAQALDAIEPSHDHAVSIALPPTQDRPVHYYVVFRRSAEGKSLISVTADLSAEFDSSR